MKIGRVGLRRLWGGVSIVGGGLVGEGEGGVPDVFDVATAKEGHAEEVADKGDGRGDDGRLVAVLLDSLEAVEEEPDSGHDARDDGGRAGPVGVPSSVEEVGDGEAHLERCPVCCLLMIFCVACRVCRSYTAAVTAAVWWWGVSDT